MRTQVINDGDDLTVFIPSYDPANGSETWCHEWDPEFDDDKVG
jgi:hypothetical protein